MSSDEDLTLILLLVMGGASAVATLAGGFFGTRETQCRASFTPWTTCTDECDTEPTRSRKYVIESGAEACPFIDGYTETESCGPVTPCCEVERDWAPEGTCSTIGLQKFTRTLRERQTGACKDFPKENFVPCCFEKGDWVLDGSCGEHTSGKQRYKQTTTGCPVDKEYKYEDCAPCVGAWSNEIPGACPSPTDCGFGGETFTKTWNVITEKIGTGTCPYASGHVETLVCDSTDPCPCPGGFGDFPPCPTECGQPQTTVYRFWQPGSMDGGKNYQSCPTSESDTCLATPSCCSRTEWTPSGQCTTEGQKQVRTVKDCTEDTDTMRFLPCCEYTPWTPSGQCTAEGIQKQLREKGDLDEQVECAEEEMLVLEQDVPCCGYTEWTPSGQCTSDQQKQVRAVGTTVPGCAPEETTELEKFMECCGYSEWEPSGACTVTPDGTDAAQSRIRTIIASSTESPCAPEETSEELTGADPCCAMDEDWATVGVCTDGVQQYTKNPVGTTCQEGDGVKTEVCAPCEGDWEPVCPSGCGYEGGSLEQTWVTTNPAIGTGTCPSGTTTTQCPATDACPTGSSPLGGVLAGIGGAAAAFCSIYPDKCLAGSPPATGEDAQNLLDDVDINCIGYWDAYGEGFPECQSCGTDAATYTSTYKHYIKQKGGGAHCPYHDGYAKTQTCPATNPCACPGSWDEETLECATTCGTPATTLSRTWNTGAKNPFLEYAPCPTTDTKDCDQVAPCCEYTEWAPLVTVGACSVDGKINVSRSKTSEPCVEDPLADNSLNKDVPCQNCVGSWSDEFPPCPTECGSPATTVYKTWTTTTPTDPNGYGAACPTDADRPSKYCLATNPCATDCEGGGWDKEFPSCPTECGKPAVTYTRNWVGAKEATNGGTACPTTDTKTCPATNPCPTDCEGGGWNNYAQGFPSCPTACDTPAVTYTRNWVGAKEATNGGKACPTTETKTCLATSDCPPCTYTSWKNQGTCSTSGTQIQYRSKTNAPCRYNPENPDTRTVNCSPCQYGWKFSHYSNSNDNPRRVCDSLGRQKCYCTRYKNSVWGVTTPAVNTSCPPQLVTDGTMREKYGEWEGCSACSPCPRPRHNQAGGALR